MKRISILLLIMASLASCSQQDAQVRRAMRQMSTRDKIAQLITVSVDSYNPPEKRFNRNYVVAVEHVGGLIIMHDRIPRSVERLNELQLLSPMPLLVSIDGEWGPSMRYGEMPFYPRQMQLGALPDDSLIYLMGKYVAEECKLMHIQVNFAPVADINTNPLNPVINTRSFGENRDVVTQYASAYMRGMQDGGICACAKHFPGHGDTDVDSHKALPLLPFTRQRLDTLELVPFRQLANEGVGMIMIGHLNVPCIDSAVSTLSYNFVTRFLKHDFDYRGIVCTDALNMKGVSDTLSPAQVALAAYKAGVDLLLMPDEVSQALDLIEEAIRKHECSRHDLNQRCRKILQLKAKAGMLDPDYQKVMDSTAIMAQLPMSEHRALVQTLCDKSITLVENRAGLVPLDPNAQPVAKIAYIGYNTDFVPLRRQYGELEGLSGYCPKSGVTATGTLLYDQLKAQRGQIDYFPLSKSASDKDIARLTRKLASYDQLIFACHDPAGRPKDNLIADNQLDALTPLFAAHPTLLIYFGTPYGMNNMPWIDKLGGIIIAYADSEQNQLAAAKILLGEQPAVGLLPVSAGPYKAR